MFNFVCVMLNGGLFVFILFWKELFFEKSLIEEFVLLINIMVFVYNIVYLVIVGVFLEMFIFVFKVWINWIFDFVFIICGKMFLINVFFKIVCWRVVIFFGFKRYVIIKLMWYFILYFFRFFSLVFVLFL